jgi:muramoyltetrapeptide carboxypeptidase
MIKIPPYLKKGDTIGIVAPAGFMPFERIQSCIEILDSWGFNLQMGATTHSNSKNYFSGTDEERVIDLQQMLDDKNVRAILCARGGYGISRIIDKISFRKFKKHPKWIIGFSDITVLHSHIISNYKVGSLHAPMANAFNDGEIDNPYLKSLRNAIEGKSDPYECPPNSMNRDGEAKGQLLGGNLALLTHIIGTPSDLGTKNKILFLEDVGEHLYNIDRMMLQLKRSGKLKNLKGLIIGGFTETKDTERPFGKTAYEIIQEHVKDYKYPVCFGFPVSHGKENYALKIGVRYNLKVLPDKTILKEQ